jgi:hypothetical protein
MEENFKNNKISRDIFNLQTKFQKINLKVKPIFKFYLKIILFFILLFIKFYRKQYERS